ncbi:MAG: hypothetical protein LAE24_11960 [Candidatus Contendobacter sp.]|nr:hypothetical protein [Candidatus Contendobacter sp.]
MAYSDFTLETAMANLEITTELTVLFPKLDPLPVPHWLQKTFSKNTPLALISEKSRSEFIVVPILLASRDLSHEKLAIYSGQRLDVDPKRGLVGECDFILALSPPILPLRSPIMTVVEAKKNDVEAGLGQCIAQMVAAQIFNQSAGHSSFSLFGCITTGEIWQFLRLTESVVSMDQRRFYLDDTGSILAAIQQMVAQDIFLAS